MSYDDPRDNLIDPDPLGTLLIILGAAGSVASIYSLWETKNNSRRQEREANYLQVRDAVMGAETALNELHSLTRSLEIIFATGSESRFNDSPMMSIASFGRVRLMFTRDGYETWQNAEQNILNVAHRLHNSINDILRQFATSTFRLPGEIAGRLSKTVERLNEVASAIGRIHFRELFEQIQFVVLEAQDTLRDIRNRLDDIIRT